jgi:hypothetical protein
MFKRMFNISFNPDELPMNGNHRNGSGNHTVSTAPPAEPEAAAAEPEPAPPTAAEVSTFASFDEIYRNAPVQPRKVAYGILKVAEMIGSPHLSGMPPESKRCAVMMALDSAGVQVEDLLQDAMERQRGLKNYEDAAQQRLQQFETVKTRENQQIQAELDRLTSDYMKRIQANVDDVARQQDNFRAWQKTMQRESQVIADAVALCAPQNAPMANNGLTAVLARCGGDSLIGKR